MVGGSSLEGVLRYLVTNEVMVRETYLVRRANAWERSGPNVGGPSGVATWRLGKIQVSLEAEGYAGALGGHLETYGDRKKT